VQLQRSLGTNAEERHSQSRCFNGASARMPRRGLSESIRFGAMRTLQRSLGTNAEESRTRAAS